jgi:acyl-CoA synthetase (AMP-forming)/AMP-acid ligase II
MILDDLFRRAGVRRPEAIALADPPNRQAFTDGAPRRLTYVQADRAISAFAARLRGLGLPTDTVVGLQLPNTVESVIALLGTLRAGMVAAPMPLLWRRREMVAALGRASAKVIVTAARIGAHASAESAMQTAADLFPIRYVCGFGNGLPDGMVPLDDVFAVEAAAAAPARSDRTAAITFEMNKDGVLSVVHTHADLIAAGEAVFREAAMAADIDMISTIPPASFAGIATTLLPWLLAGGALHLHHGFDAEVFAAQGAAVDSGVMVLPGPVVAPLAEAGLIGASAAAVLALWRAPERIAAAPAWDREAILVDVAAGDEATLVARRRGTSEMLPMATASAGVVQVGGYRFGLRDLEALVAEADPGATILGLPDGLTGERLAGSSANPDTLRTTLEERGVNPLISDAFRRRRIANS